MPKKKRVVLVEEEPQREDALETLEDEQEILAQEQAQEWLSEFQSRFSDQPVRILVEKYDEAGDWALCHKYPLASFDQEAVRSEYGGGKYRGTLFDPQGRYIKGGRVNFKFAESAIKAPVSPKPENPFENPVVAMMMKSMESQAAMLMGLTQSLVAAQGASKGTGLAEIVEVVKSINTMAPKDKPFDNFKETLGLVKLLKEATGPDEGESKGGLLSDIKEFLQVYPAIKDQLSQLKIPAPGAPPNVSVGERTIETMDPLTQKIVDLVPKFVGGARANAPVPQWGAYLLDVFDTEVLPLLLPVMQAKYKALVKDEDDVYDIMLRLAHDPGERANVFKQIAPLAPYAPWVNQVIDEAIRLAEAPDAPAPEPTPEAVPANGSPAKD